MPSWACACEQAVAHTVGIPGFGHPRKRKGYEKHRYRAFGLKSWNQAWNLCMLETLGPCKSRKLCTSDDSRINLESVCCWRRKRRNLLNLLENWNLCASQRRREARHHLGNVFLCLNAGCKFGTERICHLGLMLPLFRNLETGDNWGKTTDHSWSQKLLLFSVIVNKSCYCFFQNLVCLTIVCVGAKTQKATSKISVSLLA